MKTILAFGDSLTFGFDRATGGRHGRSDRWPLVLQEALVGQVQVIEEGLGGRNTAVDDPTSNIDRNGAHILPVLLDTHKPLDLVIIMLGTNDLRVALSGTAHRAAQGMKRLAEIARDHPYGPGFPVPQVLLVSPPLFATPTWSVPDPSVSPRNQESHLFAGLYRSVAQELGCGFFDAATVAKSTAEDGVHLDAANTRAIGTGLVPLVKELLGIG